MEAMHNIRRKLYTKLRRNPVRELLIVSTDAGLVVDRKEGTNHSIFLKVIL